MELISLEKQQNNSQINQSATGGLSPETSIIKMIQLSQSESSNIPTLHLYPLKSPEIYQVRARLNIDSSQSSRCLCVHVIQTEAASLNTSRPAASAEGNWSERDLYRDEPQPGERAALIFLSNCRRNPSFIDKEHVQEATLKAQKWQLFWLAVCNASLRTQSWTHQWARGGSELHNKVGLNKKHRERSDQRELQERL